MEKDKIYIKKVRAGSAQIIEDEVALERQIQIAFQDGQEIWVSCTPTHMGELILGRRFLMDDLTSEEYTAAPDGKPLTEVEMEEIFSIARDIFEKPGTLFTDTGCAHCCALVHEGNVVCVMEDVGRHNALDKVVGYALKHGISLENSYVFTSGRISRDYLQKVIKAGFPLVVSRAAVTDRAASLAKQEGVTMLGFVRKNTGNIYWEGAVRINVGENHA